MTGNPARKPRVLVLDDEPDLCTLYELSLLREGYEVDIAETLTDARSLVKHHNFDVVITDMQLPDGLGLTLLQDLSERKRSERCIVITAHGSAENAVQALKQGAFDYLTKPVDLQRLRQVVRDALLTTPKHAELQEATPSTKSAAGRTAADLPLQHSALAAIVGDSAAMTQVKARIAKVAPSMAPVLILGESGTGKELVARALHGCSHRANGPFVAVNCAAVPDNLLEAEFFGATKGSYTGANADRAGLFQNAHGGTLFLDEIAELPLAMQSKLLRAIQERSVRPLGAQAELDVDVRIVSATHRNLMDAVASGLFRQDLYYRINVIDLSLPPLRERREDLGALCAALLRRIAPGESVQLSAAALALLQTMPLPGNVRELENLLHRAMALADGEQLELDDPGTAAVREQRRIGGTTTLPTDLTGYLDEQERQILVEALQRNAFNRTAAAQQLGISLRQIRYRISRLGIQVGPDPSDPSDPSPTA